MHELTSENLTSKVVATDEAPQSGKAFWISATAV
jgi:hypothetical protein